MRLFPCLMLGMLTLQAHAAEPKTAEPSTPKPPLKSVSAKDYSADLMQLYRESRLEDPRVLASYSRAKSSEEQQREALGGLLPQVTVNGGANRIHQENELSRQSYHSENYSINLSQHIYNKAAWENYQKFKSLAKQ